MRIKAKTLCQYIFPAVGGLFVAFLYNVVDGILVGRGVGSAALGAVNIAVPYITFSVAVAAMFPMGGATVVAIRMGRGDRAGANQAFMTALMLTLALSALLTVTGMVFSQPIVDICGADKVSGTMRKMASDYLFYYAAFSIPSLMATCLSVFVRNDGEPTPSFVGMCIGAVSNIFLDWLFIFPLNMGVIGAAIASGLGQIFSVLVLLTHFVRRKGELRIGRFHTSGALIAKISKRGLPEAFSQLNTPVTAFCYNLMLARLVGDIGVSTFSILSFIYALANAILSGVAQGLQPLWGVSYGRKSSEEIQALTWSGLWINLALSTAIYGLLYIFAVPVVSIFNQEAELVQAASKELPVFALSFIPMALSLIYTAYLFSTKRTLQANLVAGSRTFVKAILIFAFPLWLGNSGAVWYAPMAAETISLLLALVLVKKSKLIFS